MRILIADDDKDLAGFMKAALARAVWGIAYSDDFNVVDVHLNHLREKFDAGKDFPIETVHGCGVRLKISSKTSLKK